MKNDLTAVSLSSNYDEWNRTRREIAQEIVNLLAERGVRTDEAPDIFKDVNYILGRTPIIPCQGTK